MPKIRKGLYLLRVVSPCSSRAKAQPPKPKTNEMSAHGKQGQWGLLVIFSAFRPLFIPIFVSLNGNIEMEGFTYSFFSEFSRHEVQKCEGARGTRTRSTGPGISESPSFLTETKNVTCDNCEILPFGRPRALNGLTFYGYSWRPSQAGCTISVGKRTIRRTTVL